MKNTPCLGKCKSISYIDSTPLRFCHIKTKTVQSLQRNCSLDWFYGFKLHIIINDRGDILDFIITMGN